MKKLIIVFTFAVLSVGAFAQEGKIIKTGAEALRGGTALAEQVGRQVAKAQVTLPLSLPLQFINLPSATDISLPLPSQLLIRTEEAQKLNIAPQLQTVQAEFFPHRQLSRHMKEFDDVELYAAVGSELVLYRGMVLQNLQDLKDVLINGLVLDKTRHELIHVSSYLSVALDHAYVNYGHLPAVVQISSSERLLSTCVKKDMMEMAFRRDIPPDMISNVMVFLKINGQPGWYNVKWKGDKIVFSPTLASQKEL